MDDEIVGHRTFSTGDPLYPFRHEPLTRKEAAEVMARVDAAKAKRAADMPTEENAVKALWEAWYRLKELGWREARYAREGTQAKIVELGSSGIHYGKKGDGEAWWIATDGDLWPSHPCLFKLKD